jgi:hypothetical protein
MMPQVQAHSLLALHSGTRASQKPPVGAMNPRHLNGILLGRHAFADSTLSSGSAFPGVCEVGKVLSKEQQNPYFYGVLCFMGTLPTCFWLAK